MKGKDKCNLLKSIRCKIARENGIDYHPTECTYHGDCKGTCPKCEAELQKLTNELEKLKNTGKRVAVAGIAAAMVAGSAAGCVPLPKETGSETIGLDGMMATPDEPKKNIEQTTGELVLDEPGAEEEPEMDPDEFELTGDVAFPEETADE